MCVDVYKCMYVYVCIYEHMFVYVCVYEFILQLHRTVYAMGHCKHLYICMHQQLSSDILFIVCIHVIIIFIYHYTFINPMGKRKMCIHLFFYFYHIYYNT